MTENDALVDWDAEEEEPQNVGAFSSGEIVVVEDDEPVFAGESENITIVQVDPHTHEEIVDTIDLALPPLSVDQAKEITERIKTTTNVLYLLIKRAHAGKAYTALGYKTFEEYVRSEFNYSRSYAYKLLNQANVIQAIEEKAPEGTQIYIGDSTARGLRKVLPEILEDVEEKTEGLNPDDAGAVIEDIIREHREKERLAASELDEDEDEEKRQYDGPYTGDYDGIDEDNDDDDDEDVNTFLDEDPAAARRKFDKLYNLYSGLKNIADLGDGTELVSFIPEERKAEFSNLLDSVIPWLTEFKELWEAHQAENFEEPTDIDDSDEELDYSE